MNVSRLCVPEGVNATPLPDGDAAVLDAEDVVDAVDAVDAVHDVGAYLMPVLVALGVATNLANILVLWRLLGRREARSRSHSGQVTTYRYLFWLAVTDCLASLAVAVALAHLDRSQLAWTWAFYYAHVEHSALNGLTSASVYIVVGLSVDRYVAVCHPTHYLVAAAPRTAHLRIAASFLVPVLLYLPQVFFSQVVCADSGLGWTYLPTPAGASVHAHRWKLVVELCHRVFPSTILAALNAAIIHAFIRNNTKRRAMTGHQGLATAASNTSTTSTKTTSLNTTSAATPLTTNATAVQHSSGGGGRERGEGRLVWLLVAVVVSFLASNLPATVLALIDHDTPDLGSFHLEVFRVVANCLEALGLSLNFVLYFIFVPRVRQVLRAVLTCGRC